MLVTALPAMLLACGTLPVRDAALPQTPIPSAWFSLATPPPVPQPASSLALWWQRFGDEQLTALITRSLLANTDVRSAQAALQQARALRDVKSASLGPSLSAAASAQHSQTGGNTAVNNFQAGFDASWEPDVFGGNRSALNAAEADARAAAASLASVQVSLAAEVAVTYMDLRGLQARLAIARTSLATQTETLQITRWRVQAGLASSLDEEQAIAASEQTRALIPTLQTSAAQDLSSLAVLAGLAPGALQDTLGLPAAVPQAAGDLALAFPADTLRQRPDVRAAEHRVSAALARVSQADAARYPGFQISGSLGLNALTLGSLGSSASVARALLASVSVPLFDGGALRAQVRAQEAALEQARVAYQAAVLTALKDVEDALVSLQGNRERLASLQTAADAAFNADLLARQRYTSGLIDFISVLETQRTLLATQDSVESTRASLSADHVRLYKALGGGWTPAAETTSHP
ncbi:efflux transporter outer membrane subunit [Rhodoferax sediminis]|uniref:Efflux transporter outer membrane subunit n=1 Tax=Rhodoferax sediminis TaxID=2509614 RepID=A0A515DA96_9BURK|nr:efflux transporter outer membrane subunit [Rhodoferax sediminis]QDL37332.1 efflux transporter outer membrane subunit [Rhodoferax sediminis]